MQIFFDCGSVSKCPFMVNLISSHVAPCSVDVALLAVNCLFNIPKNPRKRSPQWFTVGSGSHESPSSTTSLGLLKSRSSLLWTCRGVLLQEIALIPDHKFISSQKKPYSYQSYCWKLVKILFAYKYCFLFMSFVRQTLLFFSLLLKGGFFTRYQSSKKYCIFFLMMYNIIYNSRKIY